MLTRELMVTCPLVGVKTDTRHTHKNYAATDFSRYKSVALRFCSLKIWAKINVTVVTKKKGIKTKLYSRSDLNLFHARYFTD